jgi:hypothetical protein
MGSIDDLVSTANLLAEGSLASISANAGTGTELASFVAFDPGTYHIVVFSATGAYSREPYLLSTEVKNLDQVANCREGKHPVRSDAAVSGPGRDVLILTHRGALEARFGLPDTDAVMAKLDDLADAVNGTVISLDATAAQSAYGSWDGNYCSVEKANQVAEAIRVVIENYMTSETQYLVIAGDDEIVPFYRVPDEAVLANERDYASLSLTQFNDPTFLNPTFWTLEKGFILTDDFYGDDDPLPWRGRQLFVPDLASGRLVESPTEIIQSIDNFLAEQQHSLNTCLVTGYAFLTDSAEAINRTLSDPVTGFGMSSTELIGDNWTAADLAREWPEASPDLVSVNAHFQHWRALPGTGLAGLFYNTDLDDENANSQFLLNQVAYSAGCHAGLNIPDPSVADPSSAPDFPQALASEGMAVWMANTGFGYGIDDTIALTERLLQYLTQELGLQVPVTTGQALVNAKQRFAGSATLEGFSVYDEKVMIELTHYGLPMHEVSVPQTRDIGAVNSEFTSFESEFGMQRTTMSVDFSPTRNETDDGTYFDQNDEVQAWPGRPIQPRASVILPPLTDYVPRGQLLVNASYTDYSGIDPVIAIPASEIELPEPSFSANGWYPVKIWAVNRFGDSQNRSTLLGGQFEPNLAIERVYDTMELDTYYASAGDSDFAPPVIWGLQSEVSEPADGQVTATFAATITDGTGLTDPLRVKRVLLTWTVRGSGTLQTVPMKRDIDPDTGLGDPSLWIADVTVAEADQNIIEYYIQALDVSGNVATSSKEGFHLAGAESPDAALSIGSTQTVTIFLERDLGNGVGFQPVPDGTKSASPASLREEILASIKALLTVSVRSELLLTCLASQH